MRPTKLFTTIFLLLAFGVTAPIMAQVVGGRKKEHRNQHVRGKLFGHKSRGNANSFAKGGHTGGLARLFKRKSGVSGPWVYHSTKPGIKQRKEQPKLFSRNRTKGKRFTDGIIAQQNRQRNGSRVRGSSSFIKKRH